MATTETRRSISDRFNVTESSVHRIIERISKICTNSSGKFIIWSKTEQHLNETLDGFDKKKSFKGYIGAIDGSHIPIKKNRILWGKLYQQEELSINNLTIDC